MDIVIGKAKVHLIRGDITDQETVAIVNAANPSPYGRRWSGWSNPSKRMTEDA